MQENEEQQPKHPIEMTTDELLDYSIAPPVAERLKAMVREGEASEDCDSEEEDS